jgi:hypothetical protein
LASLRATSAEMRVGGEGSVCTGCSGEETIAGGPEHGGEEGSDGAVDADADEHGLEEEDADK